MGAQPEASENSPAVFVPAPRPCWRKATLDRRQILGPGDPCWVAEVKGDSIDSRNVDVDVVRRG